MANFALPLSIVAPSTYAIPYILAIVVVFAIILSLLAKYRSLRNYARKRNIAVYCAFILVLGLLMFQADSVSRRALVGYGLSNSYDKAYRGQTNQVVWSCSNHGGRQADFYLVVNSVNASFISQNKNDYVLASSTTVKVPFSISSGGSESRPVFFTVEDGATGFSFSTIVENKGYGGFDVNTAMTEVTFVWNSTENCYVEMYSSVVTA
jgi:hypothetical protein